MTTFVLVHGAWHGAWCWDKVVPELENKGHSAIAIDLPGSGQDKTPLNEVTLDSYADRIEETLDLLEGDVVLVGHSMGGAPITVTAERRPEKIKTLVYLTAFLPQDGESLFDVEGRNENPTVPPALIVSDDEVSATLMPDRLQDLFFHDCSDEDFEFAMENLTPQALAPLATPVSVSEAGFGSVDRCYIECLDDHAIHIALQRDMNTASPCAQVFEIDSSHSPFLSKPGELADILASVA